MNRLDQLFQRFLRERTYINNVTSSTCEWYESAWKAFTTARAQAPERPASAPLISKTDLQFFVVHLRERGVRPVSCNTWVRALNAFCRWLHEQGEIAAPVKLQPQRLEKRIISHAQRSHPTCHAEVQAEGLLALARSRGCLYDSRYWLQDRGGADGPRNRLRLRQPAPDRLRQGPEGAASPFRRRFTATNVQLRELIRFAYQVQPFQIAGEGDVLAEKFDVIAKAEGDLPAIRPGVVGPVNLMVQRLLTERFRLRAHRENREMAIYALVRAKESGALGAEIEFRAEDCEAELRGQGRPTPDSPGRPGWPVARGEAIPCGVTMRGTGRIASGGMAMSQFAGTLAEIVGDGVLDRTGLLGVYALQLDYAPDTTPPISNGQSTDLNRPSVFTALQEQLGLKLEPTRAPVEVLVIDSVQRPTPD